MDTSEYQRLRQLIDQQYAKREREIAAERDADLAALLRVCQIAGYSPNGTRPPSLPIPPTVEQEEHEEEDDGEHDGAEDQEEAEKEDDETESVPEPAPGTSISDVVWKALFDLPNDTIFDLRSVQRRMRSLWPNRPTYSPNTITQVLRGLVRENLIRVVRSGQGRRPTTYEFVLNEPQPPEST